MPERSRRQLLAGWWEGEKLSRDNSEQSAIGVEGVVQQFLDIVGDKFFSAGARLVANPASPLGMVEGVKKILSLVITNRFVLKIGRKLGRRNW